MSKNTTLANPKTHLQQAAVTLLAMWRTDLAQLLGQDEQNLFEELAEALEAELADSGEPVALVTEAQLSELAQCNGMQLWSENPNMFQGAKGDSPAGTPLPPGHVNLYRIAPENLRVTQARQDTARLDWLDQNIFSRENLDFHGKLDKNYSMWVTFAPRGVQGSARAILDAAISKQSEAS